MEPKILIVIEGGIIQNIIANMPIHIAIINYDVSETGDPDDPEDNNPFRGVYQPDLIVKDGEFYKSITDFYPLTSLEEKVRNELKRIHF